MILPTSTTSDTSAPSTVRDVTFCGGENSYAVEVEVAIFERPDGTVCTVVVTAPRAR
jgi:hypothetical protein